EIVNTATIGAETPNGKTVTDVSGTGIDNDTPTTVPVAEGPAAVNDAINTPQQTPVSIPVLDNDREGSSPLDPSTVYVIDPETGGQVKEVTIPNEGTYTVQPDGTIVFTPVD